MQVVSTGSAANSRASEVTAVGASRNGVSPKLISVLVITAGDDLQVGVDALLAKVAPGGKRTEVIRVDHLPGQSPQARTVAMERALAALCADGRIGPDTQVIVTLHGNTRGSSFQMTDKSGTVRMDGVKFVDFLSAHGKPKIHFLSCQSGAMREALKDKDITCFLHAGKKNVLLNQGDELMAEFCDFLFTQKESPADAQIYAFFEARAGENIAMTGHGNLSTHDSHDLNRNYRTRAGALSAQFSSDVEKKKAHRTFLSTLEHGSAKKVQEMLTFFGDALKLDAPAFLVAAGSDREAAEKLRLLSSTGILIDEPDRNGFSALHGAANFGGLDAATQLLNAGANINLQSATGATALGLAIWGNHLGVANLLLARGADAAGTGIDHKSLIKVVVEKGDLPALRLLLQYREKQGALGISKEDWIVVIAALSDGQHGMALVGEMLKCEAQPGSAGRASLQNAMDYLDSLEDESAMNVLTVSFMLEDFSNL